MLAAPRESVMLAAPRESVAVGAPTRNDGVVDAAAASCESPGGTVDSPPPIFCGNIDERVPLVEQIRAHNMILDLNCVGGGEFLQFPDDTFESTFRRSPRSQDAP